MVRYNMPDKSSKSDTVSRRRFVQTVGATGTVAGIAGCAASTDEDTKAKKQSDNDGKTIVTVAGSDATRQNTDAINEVLHEAGLPEDIEIDHNNVAGNTDDVQSQYRQWLSAGRPNPDIFRMDSGWTIPFIVRGQLVNLSDRLSKQTVNRINNDFFDSMIATASDDDGNLFGVPQQIGLPTMQYRKDLVEEAGFDTEGWDTEPMSWKRFSEVVSETKDNSGLEYGFAWQGNDYEGLSCCTFNELMTSWGGAYFGGPDNLFGPVGDRPVTVDEEPVLNAIRMGRTFIRGQDDEHALDGYKQISPDATLQWTEGPSKSAFMEGNAVALRYWPSGLYEAVDEFGDDAGVMPIPYGVEESESKYDGIGGTASALGGWHYTLNPNSEKADAAVQVLEAFASTEFQTFQFTELGYLTPDASALQTEEAQNVDIWGDHLDTLRVAGENSIPRPVTVVWPDESPAISGEVSAALAGQKSPEDAMSALKEQLTQIENSV